MDKAVRVSLFSWELNSKKVYVATDTNSCLLLLRKCKESSLLNKQVGAYPKDGVSVPIYSWDIDIKQSQVICLIPTDLIKDHFG